MLNENLYRIQERPKNRPDANWVRTIFYYNPNPLGLQLMRDKLKTLRERRPDTEFRPILRVVNVEEYAVDEGLEPSPAGAA